MLKKAIKFVTKTLGYEIKKIDSTPAPVEKPVEKSFEYTPKTINDWIASQKFNTIIDIGANEGQFALKMRLLFPDAQIISFEPIADVFETLKKNFSGDEKFTAFNFGLGASSGESIFYLNEYSPSSSLLEMNEVHKQAFDFARKENHIEIKLEKLDDAIIPHTINSPALLKIDVQGYEIEVIKGGRNILSQVDMIIVEMSFSELYKKQPLFDDVYEILKAVGFKYAGNFEQLLSPVNGAILQADSIFKK